MKEMSYSYSLSSTTKWVLHHQGGQLPPSEDRAHLDRCVRVFLHSCMVYYTICPAPTELTTSLKNIFELLKLRLDLLAYGGIEERPGELEHAPRLTLAHDFNARPLGYRHKSEGVAQRNRP